MSQADSHVCNGPTVGTTLRINLSLHTDDRDDIIHYSRLPVVWCSNLPVKCSVEETFKNEYHVC